MHLWTNLRHPSIVRLPQRTPIASASESWVVIWATSTSQRRIQCFPGAEAHEHCGHTQHDSMDSTQENDHPWRIVAWISKRLRPAVWNIIPVADFQAILGLFSASCPEQERDTTIAEGSMKRCMFCAPKNWNGPFCCEQYVGPLHDTQLRWHANWGVNHLTGHHGSFIPAEVAIDTPNQSNTRHTGCKAPKNDSRFCGPKCCNLPPPKVMCQPALCDDQRLPDMPTRPARPLTTTSEWRQAHWAAHFSHALAPATKQPPEVHWPPKPPHFTQDSDCGQHLEHWLELPGRGHPVSVTDHD